MLRRIVSLPFKSLRQHFISQFSSAATHSPAKDAHHHDHSHQVAKHDDHHHDHHHTDYSVNIDQDATWLRYRGDPKMIYLAGLEETHITLRDYDFSDPYEHLKNKPFYNSQVLYYADPWRHDDAHDPLIADGDQGYYSGQDPLESRFLSAQGAIITAMVFMGGLFFYQVMDPSPVPQAALYKSRITREWVHAQLEQKNAVLNQLKAKERELLQTVSGKGQEAASQ